MDQRTLYSRTILCQKVIADNYFEIFTTFQNSGITMLKHSLEQCSWISEQGKKSYLSWAGECAKNTEALKKMMDQGYTEMDQFCSGSQMNKNKEKVSDTQQKDVDSSGSTSTPDSVEVKKNVRQTKKTSAKVTPKKRIATVSRKSTAKKSAAPSKGSADVSTATTTPATKPVTQAAQIVKSESSETKEAQVTSAIKTSPDSVKAEKSKS